VNDTKSNILEFFYGVQFGNQPWESLRLIALSFVICG